VALIITPADATIFRIDCTKTALADISAKTYDPGDQILLPRGQTCQGTLSPNGSGAAGDPIVIGAYGSGPAPIIDASGRNSAVFLKNQHHWVIQDIETVGGDQHGINITGDTPGTLSYFRIDNVEVRGVTGTPTDKNHDGALIVHPTPDAGSTVFNNVRITNALVHHSSQWAGIEVMCQTGVTPASNPAPILIDNSVAHHVGGDGIVAFACSTATIEDSVAHHGGQSSQVLGGTNGIWTWACQSCTVRRNEAYAMTSTTAGDGGAFDIDWGSHDTVVEQNYGHDNDGYCVAIFGAQNLTTTNSVVRRNICVDNGQKASFAYQGDMFLSTWAGGVINGVKIHGNTFMWRPVADGPVFNARGVTWAGTKRNYFRNNVILSQVPTMIDTKTNVRLGHNNYWEGDLETPVWKYGGNTYSTFWGYKVGSGQDANGKFTEPMLKNVTYSAVGKPAVAFIPQATSPLIDAGAFLAGDSYDFLGVPIPQGAAPDIGAREKP
jgi:hypothetical protein